MTEKLNFKDRFYVENLDALGEDIRHGAVEFDHEKCKGCGLCEQACFTGVIVNSRSRKPEMQKGVGDLCVSCGACTAICPEGAITLREFLEFHHFFRGLDRDIPQPPRRF